MQSARSNTDDRSTLLKKTGYKILNVSADKLSRSCLHALRSSSAQLLRWVASFDFFCNREEHTYSLSEVGAMSKMEDGKDGEGGGGAVMSGRSAVTVVVEVVVTVTVDRAAVSGQR
jgi:hypothetical protein